MKSGVNVHALIEVKYRQPDNSVKEKHLVRLFKVSPSAFHYDDPLQLQYEVEYLSKLKGLAEARKYMGEFNKPEIIYTELVAIKTIVIEFDIIETED